MQYTADRTQLTKKHESDAGLDIYSASNVLIPPKSKAIIPTGLKIAIPEGYVGLIWSRSGLSVNRGIEVGAGCIDAGYRGEVGVVLYNHSFDVVEIKENDRIAQLLTVPILLCGYTRVDSLDDTDRSIGGFGSTGK